MSTKKIKYLPYLLPYVRVLFPIHSITSTGWDETTGRPGGSCSRCSAGRWRCASSGRGTGGGTDVRVRTAVSAHRRRTRRGIPDLRKRTAIRPAAVSRSGSAASPLHRRDARAASSTEVRCCRLNGLVSVANAPSASSLSARSAS